MRGRGGRKAKLDQIIRPWSAFKPTTTHVEALEDGARTPSDPSNDPLEADQRREQLGHDVDTCGRWLEHLRDEHITDADSLLAHIRAGLDDPVLAPGSVVVRRLVAAFEEGTQTHRDRCVAALAALLGQQPTSVQERMCRDRRTDRTPVIDGREFLRVWLAEPRETVSEDELDDEEGILEVDLSRLREASE